MSKLLIAAARLREILHYNEETGAWTWRVRQSQRSGPGDAAGSLDASKGYMRISIDGRDYRSHRLAFLYMTGEFPAPGLDVDHRDRNRANNSWRNLRLATRSENNQNSARANGGNSLRGASWDKDRRLWRTQIHVNGITQYLGHYPTELEAHNVHMAEKAKVHPFFHAERTTP